MQGRKKERNKKIENELMDTAVDWTIVSETKILKGKKKKDYLT